MPALANTRHERFAQELAKGKSQSEAYRLAGYDGTDAAMEASASRLVRNVKVASRVSELQANAANRTEITVASVTKRLLAIATKAEAKDEATMLNVARASLMDAAKLNGLVVDKSQVEQTVEVTDARERLARIVAGHTAAGAAGESARKPH